MIQRKEFAPKPSMQFTVTESSGLLAFLLQSMPNQSRNHVKSLLTHRLVSVDGVVTTQYDTQLREGQKVSIQRLGAQAEKQKCPLDILYEDGDIIVVNKPAGLLSIASDKEKDMTAYHILTDYVKQQNTGNRIFTVHRLDKETSGILMVAKNEKMKLALQDNWAQLVLKRGYVAVVEGNPKEKSGTIQSWLRETKTHLMYSSTTAGDGLEAITLYKVLNENEQYALLDVQLQTGRKNQIRVHMKELGHPVAGDKKYAATTDPIKRLCLHAYQLELKHPVTGKVMSFETRIPHGFTALLKQAGQDKKPKMGKKK